MATSIGGDDEHCVVSLSAAAVAGSPLPYIVELWRLDRHQPERVIGRAARAVLARAIYKAAINELPDRRVVLRRGSQILSDTHPETGRT